MGVTLPHRAAALMVVVAGVPGGIPTSRCAPFRVAFSKGPRATRVRGWHGGGAGPLPGRRQDWAPPRKSREKVLHSCQRVPQPHPQ